jgi:hypothetical protein
MIDFMMDDFEMDDDSSGLTTNPQINDLLAQTDQLTADLQQFGAQHEEYNMQDDYMNNDTGFNLTNDPSFNQMMDDTNKLIEELQQPIEIPLSDMENSPSMAGLTGPVEMPSFDGPSNDPVTNQLLAQTHNLVDESNQLLKEVYENNPQLGNKPNSAVEAVMNMTSSVVKDAVDVTDGNLSGEELAAMQNKYARQSAMLDGMNISDSIRNSVNEDMQNLRDSNYAHHSRTMADGYEQDANSYIESATQQAIEGKSAESTLNAAQTAASNADYYKKQAGEYENS